MSDSPFQLRMMRAIFGSFGMVIGLWSLVNSLCFEV